jgi:hypothetical protein
MGVGKVIHYLGSVLLFVAMILTIVINISAPVVDSISFTTLNLPGNADAKFGVFGYCSKGQSGGWSCSDSTIGYNPAKVIEDINGGDFSRARGDTIEALTRVLVLHPIGTVALFLAFILSLIAGSTILSILATLVASAAFIINTIALVVDFVTFSLLGNEINDQEGSATYGSAAWLSLVAAVLALVATIIMFVTCCAGRRKKSRESRKSTDNAYTNTHAY